MRYRLRTLLIVLAIGPPIIALTLDAYRQHREWQHERLKASVISYREFKRIEAIEALKLADEQTEP